MTTTLPIDQMIDIEHGQISREIFVAPEFHREELDKLPLLSLPNQHNHQY